MSASYFYSSSQKVVLEFQMFPNFGCKLTIFPKQIQFKKVAAARWIEQLTSVSQ